MGFYVSLLKEAPRFILCYGKGDSFGDALAEGLAVRCPKSAAKIRKLKKLDKFDSMSSMLTLVPMYDLDMYIFQSNQSKPIYNTVPDVLAVKYEDVGVDGEWVAAVSSVRRKLKVMNKLPTPEQLRTGKYMIFIRPLFFKKLDAFCDEGITKLLEKGEYTVEECVYAYYILRNGMLGQPYTYRRVDHFNFLLSDAAITAFGLAAFRYKVTFKEPVTGSLNPYGIYPILWDVGKLELPKGKVMVAYLEQLLKLDNPMLFIRDVFGIQLPRAADLRLGEPTVETKLNIPKKLRKELDALK